MENISKVKSYENFKMINTPFFIVFKLLQIRHCGPVNNSSVFVQRQAIKVKLRSRF